MIDVFENSWQIEEDIILMKENCKYNIIEYKSVMSGEETLCLPFSYFYEGKVKYYNLEVTRNLEKNEFLEIDAKGEMTIFCENKAIGSIDFMHNKIYLDQLANDVNQISISLDAHYQEMNRYKRMYKKNYPPIYIKSIRKYNLDLTNYKVVLLLEEVFKFLYENKQFDKLIQMRRMLNKIELNDFKQISNITKVFVEDINEQIKYNKTTFIGNSHLDLLFKWSCKETIQKNERTNSNFYSNYVFDKTKKMIFSQVYLIDIMKEYQLELFKQMIGNNYMEIISPAYTEFDTNIPSTQSISNNIKIGKKILKEKLDVEANTLYLPDTFGYVQNLPTILKGNGIDYFVTTKLLWNDTNKFRHTTFNWKDKDNIIKVYKTDRGYGGRVSLSELISNINNSKVEDILYLYGEGDGGGGPVIEDFLLIDVFKEKFSNLNITDHTLSEFLSSINNYGTTITGELYLEKHRGVYTTGNRLKEMLINAEEYLKTLEDGVEKIKIMKFISYLSFHDTISGTMISQGYDDVYQMYNKLNIPELFIMDNYLENNCSENIAQINIYNDRSGYFDSWDISKEFYENQVEDSTAEYELITHKVNDNHYKLGILINSCMSNKLVKLELLNTSNVKSIKCKINDNENKEYQISEGLIVPDSKFEFPHQRELELNFDDKIIKVKNNNKYGSSFINKYELTLLKTGNYPNPHSEVFPSYTQIDIIIEKKDTTS